MAGLGDTYAALLDAVSGIGWQNGVIDHEPLSAPDGDGIVVAVFPSEPMAALAESSGLAAADTRIGFIVRLMYNALAMPQGINPRGREIELLDGFDKVMEVLIGGFTLGGTTRSIDVLGESGEQLSGQWGYTQIDSAIFRIVDITVPVMINNAWTYGA